MNNLSIRESVQRANSGFRFYAYRRRIGNPISLLGVLREWPRRFWFEWRKP
jgi:hypothetical protein